MRTTGLAVALAAVIAIGLLAAGPATPASASDHGHQIHCVKYGETLYGIAYRHGVSAHAIAHYNGIWNPNYIVAGSCLKIPTGHGRYDKQVRNDQGGYGYGGYDGGRHSQDEDDMDRDGYDGKGMKYGHGGYGYDGEGMKYGHGGYGDDGQDNQVKYGYGSMHGGKYCVRYGDTLSGIAAKFGVSTWALAKANWIRNPDYIRVGQCLMVPGYAY
jgi:putative chitinase